MDRNIKIGVLVISLFLIIPIMNAANKITIIPLNLKAGDNNIVLDPSTIIMDGNISLAENIDVSGNLSVEGYAQFKTPFGGFSSDEDTTTVITATLTNAGEYYNITNLIQSLVQVGNNTHFTINETNGTITFIEMGVEYYGVFLGGSYSTDKTCEIKCGVYKNYFDRQEITLTRTINNINSVGAASDYGHVYVTDGDILNIKCKSDTINTDVTIKDFTFEVERVSKS